MVARFRGTIDDIIPRDPAPASNSDYETFQDQGLAAIRYNRIAVAR